MSETKKMCSCGFPQSYPIPHEHDQSKREKVIIKHFKQLNEQLLEACKATKKYIDLLHKHWEKGDVETLNQGTGVVSADDLDAAAETAFQLSEAAIEAAESQP